VRCIGAERVAIGAQVGPPWSVAVPGRAGFVIVHVAMTITVGPTIRAGPLLVAANRVENPEIFQADLPG